MRRREVSRDMPWRVSSAGRKWFNVARNGEEKVVSF
jgi:hypothetical protein